MTGTVYPDTSYYQRPLDLSFERGIASFRAFDGEWEDPIFRVNLRAAAALQRGNRISCAVAYLVYRPGTVDLQVAAFKRAVLAVFGEVPRWLVAEIDAESWAGRITGDHSVALNRSYALLCQFLHADYRRVGGYGNRPDLLGLWRSRPARMWVTLARYGRLDFTFPNQLAQQYTDGQSQNSVAGLPSSSAPFGLCDHNYTPGAPAQFAAAVGAILTTKTPEEAVVATLTEADKLGIGKATAEAIVASGLAEDIASGTVTTLVRRSLAGANHGKGWEGMGPQYDSLADYLCETLATHKAHLREAQTQTGLIRQQNALLQQLVSATPSS